MSREPIKITDRDIERLRAMANVGLPFTTASRHLGVDRRSLMRALKLKGLGEWAQNSFPKRPGYGGRNPEVLREPVPEKSSSRLPDFDPESLFIKSAAMPWRKAA